MTFLFKCNKGCHKSQAQGWSHHFGYRVTNLPHPNIGHPNKGQLWQLLDVTCAGQRIGCVECGGFGQDYRWFFGALGSKKSIASKIPVVFELVTEIDNMDKGALNYQNYFVNYKTLLYLIYYMVKLCENCLCFCAVWRYDFAINSAF